MLAQVLPVDPAPFTAWGILGILAFVIVVLGGIIWKLFVQQGMVQQNRDKLIMDFVNTHRSETTTSMQGVAETVRQAYEGLRGTLDRQSRMLDEVLMAQRVLDQVEKLRQRGTVLTQEEIEKVVRSVMHERQSLRGGP